MKNLSLLAFFLLLFTSGDLLAQKKKKLYFDENGNPVSKREHQKLTFHRQLFSLEVETDTAVIYILEPREKRGQLDSVALAKIKHSLETVSGNKIGTAELIVVNYYPGLDRCNASGNITPQGFKIRDMNYQLKLKNLCAVSQFYIFNDSTGLWKYGGEEFWKPDLDATIERTFFKYLYPCGSFVVIHPDGRYIASFGEYSSLYVLKKAQELLNDAVFQKKKLYFDENWKPISRSDFANQTNHEVNLDMMSVTDSTIVNFLIYRKNWGFLDSASLSKLKNDLQNTSGKQIGQSDLIVIDYYPGLDACNASGSSDAESFKTWDYIHRTALKNLDAHVSQFYIFKEKDGLERYGGDEFWRPDLNATVETTFFKLHYPCNSFVVIHPDGRYISWFGEYSNDQVEEFGRELLKKK